MGKFKMRQGRLWLWRRSWRRGWFGEFDTCEDNTSLQFL